jgi:hypothetical protein
MVSPAWVPVGADVVGGERGPSCAPGLKLGLEQADKAMVPATRLAQTAARIRRARDVEDLKLDEVRNFFSALLLDLNRRRYLDAA